MKWYLPSKVMVPISTREALRRMPGTEYALRNCCHYWVFCSCIFIVAVKNM